MAAELAGGDSFHQFLLLATWQKTRISLVRMVMKKTRQYSYTLSNCKICLALFTLLFSFLLTACGSDSGNITEISQHVSSNLEQPKEACVMWSYDPSIVPDLVGFRIYDSDGNLVHETHNTTSLHVDFPINIGDDPITFTMTAFDVDGNESAHSAPYTVSNIQA